MTAFLDTNHVSAFPERQQHRRAHGLGSAMVAPFRKPLRIRFELAAEASTVDECVCHEHSMYASWPVGECPQ